MPGPSPKILPRLAGGRPILLDLTLTASWDEAPHQPARRSWSELLRFLAPPFTAGWVALALLVGLVLWRAWIRIGSDRCPSGRGTARFARSIDRRPGAPPPAFRARRPPRPGLCRGPPAGARRKPVRAAPAARRRRLPADKTGAVAACSRARRRLRRGIPARMPAVPRTKTSSSAVSTISRPFLKGYAMNLGELQGLAQRVRAEVGKAVHGQDEVVELLLVGMFARGHCLIEGPPGTAKTLLAQSLAAALQLNFGRIQFTPDLMPGDVLGANIFDFRESAFHLVKGPIFTRLAAGRRDQPRAAEDAGGPPPGDAGAGRHDRRRRPSARRATSSSSPPRTRSSSRAPIRCPRRSSTASCSRSTFASRRRPPNSRSCAATPRCRSTMPRTAPASTRWRRADELTGARILIDGVRARREHSCLCAGADAGDAQRQRDPARRLDPRGRCALRRRAGARRARRPRLRHPRRRQAALPACHAAPGRARGDGGDRRPNRR